MKIDSTPKAEALKAYNARSLQGSQPYKGPQDSARIQQARSSDRVHISGTVNLMQDIQKAVAEAPDVRMDKVREVETKIEKGIYKPDLTVVADRLLSPSISDRI